MKTYKTEQLRNVGLFSHGGAGKTTLAEAMLFNAGAINRLGRVDDGTTVSDYEPEETRRHITVQLSVLPLEWKGMKINLIDAPGYVDFVGEVAQAMRVVDSAMLLFEAVAGVDVGAENAWSYADLYELPRVIVINKMDRENASFDRTLDQIVARFGNRVIPVQLPIGAESSFDGVIDLLKMKAYRGVNGEESEIPAELAARAEEVRTRLIEAAVETDDDLMNKYLEGETLTGDEVARGLRAGVISGSIIPVFCTAGMQNRGVFALMDAIVSLLPSPADRPAVKATVGQDGQSIELKASESGQFAALVFKSTADPFVGKLTYFRVYSGTMNSDSMAFNSNKGRDERLGQLFVIRGKSQETTVSLVAGDIGAVAKLQDTITGETLATHEHPLVLPGIDFPPAVFSAAVSAKTKADVDKLGSALSRLVDEDPVLSVRKDPDTGEMVLTGTGEAHLEVASERAKRKFGVEFTLSVPRVPYKETITTTTRSEFKHKKQSGGHGQYGHVVIQMEPLDRGAGFEFAEKVVGGSVPRNYIPAVEKGVREVLGEGALAGYPVIDLRVTLLDGSFHPVDSSEMAFKIASSQAFKKGFETGHAVLVEPIMTLTVTVPEQYVGDVMGDLNTKRSRVLGMTPQGNGLTVIEAQAPLAEIQRYSAALRSLSQGRGSYKFEFSHYEEVPQHISQQVVAEAKREKAEAK